MASVQTKVYRISIEMDAAKQELADASKRLAELDTQLQGLDRDTDAAKGIVAEMAKLVGQVGSAEGKVEALGESLDALKPGTIPALEATIEDLEASLRQATEGTVEFDAALLKLGQAKGQLKSLEDQIDAIADTKQHAAAFVDLANGLVGVTTIATTSGQALGLSQQAADAYQQKLVTLIAVMDGVEQISKAANGEVLGSVKATYAGAKAWLGFGESAATAGKVSRAALLSIGIGAILLLLGLVAANFDKIKEVGQSIYQKLKPAFDGVSAVIDTVIAKARNLASFLSFGLVDDAAKHAQAVATELRQKELAAHVEQTARLIEVLKARGTDTLALEVENSKRRLESLKQTNDEEKKAYQDALKEFVVLRTQYQKRANDDEKATRLAHLNGLIAAEQARQGDGYKLDLAAKKESLSQLLKAQQEGQYVSKAQLEQARDAISTAEIAHDTQQAEKKRNLRLATLNAELAMIQAKGRDGLALIGTDAEDEIKLAQQVNAKKVQIAEQNLANLKEQRVVDRAAVKAANQELANLAVEGAQLVGQAQVAALQQAQQLRKKVEDAILGSADGRDKRYQQDAATMQTGAARLRALDEEAFNNEVTLLDKQSKDTLKMRLEFAKSRLLLDQDTSEKGQAQLRADVQKVKELEVELAQRQPDLGGTILSKLFGIKDEDIEGVKGRLNEAFASIANSVQGLVNGMLSAGISEADAQVQAAQARLQELDTQISDLSSKRQADEQALVGAVGARRDYLLKKIQAERKAEADLSAQKTVAAQKEEAAQKQKAKLEKEQQGIAAASTAIEAVLLAIQAAQAVVKASSAGKFGIDNIALAIAAAAAIGASIVSVKNAAKAFEAGGVVGDDGVLRGPRHSAGGIPFTVAGKPGFEAEGGEHITPVDATQKNGPLLQLIRTQGRSRTIGPLDMLQIASNAQSVTTSIQPTPKAYFEAGGVLSSAGVSGGQASSADLGALASRLDRHSDLLGQVVAHLGNVAESTAATQEHTAATATHTDTIRAYGPPVLEFGYDAELKRQDLQKGMERAEAMVTL
jgi:hypothetical protein